MYSEHITAADDLNRLSATAADNGYGKPIWKDMEIELNLIYGIKVTREDSLPLIVVFRT